MEWAIVMQDGAIQNQKRSRYVLDLERIGKKEHRLSLPTSKAFISATNVVRVYPYGVAPEATAKSCVATTKSCVWGD